jgi:EmrB/QacA subfamily drug resistance transporter
MNRSVDIGRVRHGGSTPSWTLWIIAVASMMAALDTLMVSTALTTIKNDLHASLAQLEWTINAYNLTLAVLLLPAAALGDRFGRRLMFVVGLGVFVAASAACALAPNAIALIVARGVQGAGAALVTTLSVALVSAAFPPERLGAAIGILQGVVGLALVAGPVLGGAIATGIAWQWIFWLNVPLGLIVLPLVVIHVGESRGTDAKLDLGGFALVTAGSFGVVWSLVRGNEIGWASPEILLTGVAAVGLLAAFIWWEIRTSQPMLPMGWFASRTFSAGNAVTVCIFAGIFTGLFFIAQLLQTVLGYNALQAGIRLLPWSAALVLVAPIIGRLSDRVGERPLLVVGLTLDAVGYTWLALIVGPDMTYRDMVVPLLLTALGGSTALPPVVTAVLRGMPTASLGKASGANGMFRELGGVFGLAVAVLVFATAGGYTSAAAFTDGVGPAFGVAAAFGFVGAVVSAAIPRKENSRVPDAPTLPAAEQVAP